MNKKIIVRADDLGFSEAVNYGIAKSVKDGIVRSVGLMPNMESARHGIKLLKDEDVCIGMHTNICVGTPVSNPVLIPSLVKINGQFKPSSAYREAASINEDFVNVDEAIMEIEAQYQKFIELVGLEPAYFEAHAISSPNFFKALKYVAQKYNLPYLDSSIYEPVLFKNSLLKPYMESMNETYDPFKTLKKVVETPLENNEIPYLILHPGYLDEYILNNSSLTYPRVKEVTMATDQQTKDYLESNNIQVITYSDLN